MQLNPYLNFDGNAEEAFRFYQTVFGGEVFVQKMSQAPGAENLPENGADAPAFQEERFLHQIHS